MLKNKLSRRDFIKDAAIGAASIAGVGMVSVPVQVQAKTQTQCPGPVIPTKWDEEADVVIAGYGSTGLPAAIEAYNAGAKVLIIDKNDWAGGDMRRCGGGIAQAGSIVQKALGIQDSQQAFLDYMLACGEGYVDPDLLLPFSKNDNVDWVIEYLGGQPVSQWKLAEKMMNPGPGLNISGTPVYFDKYKMPKATRCHWFNGTQTEAFREGWPVPGGTGVFKTFDDNIKKRNIKTLMQTGLTELIVNANREVLGVKAMRGDKPLLIKANRGVVIGTGHWLLNAKLVKNYLLTDVKDPKSSLGGFWTNKLAAPTQGEGVEAALELGADVSFIALGYNGGLKINPKAQVLDVYGKPIARLYAGGRATGGIVKTQYPQCGIYLSSAIFFGRAAGRNAAAEKPWVAAV